MTLVLLLIIGLALAFLWSLQRGAGLGSCGDHAAAEHAKLTPRVVEDALRQRLGNLEELIEAPHLEPGEDIVEVVGRFRVAPEAVFSRVRERLSGSGWTALLQEDPRGRPRLLLLSDRLASVPAKPGRRWVHALLFLATLATTTWAGAAHHGVDLLREPRRFAEGLPYSLALMLILGAHEMGHYVLARIHGMRVTLPYFVPVPFGLGTFGAFIRMQSPPKSRGAMFDVAVAGPLAGLALAVPALLVGLQRSTVVPAGSGDAAAGVEAGASLLFALLAKVSLGVAVEEGHRLVLHPIAFAGWLGLFLTALNLAPIGQLDGGHLAHALLGRRRAETLGAVALAGLVALGLFVWSGFLTWAILVYFIAGTKSAPPLDDVTRLDKRRALLGAAAFVVLLLILTPVPHALYARLGLHCPYL